MASVLLLALVVVFAALFMFGLPIALIVWMTRREKAETESLRTRGTLCTAYVKSFRRVSMTQHRVLFEIRLPEGPIGREFMLSGLDDTWLADVAALQKPIQVYARADANTVLIDRSVAG